VLRERVRVRRVLSGTLVASVPLVQTLAELSLVVDKMAAAVTHCSRDLRYLWVSRQYAAWLGMEPEELAGRPIIEVIGAAGWEGIRHYVERVLSGESVEYVDRVDFHGIGLRWIHAAYTPTADGWIAVVRDIDDQKRAEIALKDADRQKDDFLAMLGHELRNPLAAVMMAVELLRTRGTEARELQIIDRQVRHLVRLVNDLLEVSRIGTGKVELQRRVVKVGELMTYVAAVTRPAFEKRHHKLVVHAPEPELRVDADPDRLAQVLVNLLNNAAKFTDNGGTIAIDAHEENGTAVITVDDDGRGMAAELLAHVFEPFVQGPTARDREPGGLGLGLSLVKGLTELHGGSVSASSAGAGRGSRFTVRLPALTRAAPADAIDPSESRPIAFDPQRRSVLVVEDNVDVAELTVMALHVLGYEAALAHDGPEALRLMHASCFDLAVVDIGLPGMDGYTLARAIRSERPEIPLVALTGYGQESDVERSLEAGFDKHLTKPVGIRELGAALEALHIGNHLPSSVSQ
jgi:PAS domain S-box-containing protein